jgi:hypothetical protein
MQGRDLRFGALTAMRQDRGLRRSDLCISPSSGSLAGCSCWAAARRPRTLRSWCSAMKSPSCAARSPVPGQTGPTGQSWPRWLACCPPGCAAIAWSRQELCWPGTAASSSASGHTHGQARPASGCPGDPRPGVATGPGKPVLGVPPRARRAIAARPPHQRGDRPADPPRCTPASAPEAGHLLAGVPAHSGARASGLRLLPRRHDLPAPPVRISYVESRGGAERS